MTDDSRDNPPRERRLRDRLLDRLIGQPPDSRQPAERGRAGQPIQLHCYGVHVLRLSGSTPEDSDDIVWDQRRVTKEQLIGLLRYDLDPDNLREIEHRSHKRKVDVPPLFDLAPLVEGGAA